MTEPMTLPHRIEAAFVPRDEHDEDHSMCHRAGCSLTSTSYGLASCGCWDIELRARAEAAEAENVRLTAQLTEAWESERAAVEAFERAKNAADAILAPLCAEVGRWLIEGKDEPDMIKVAHDYGVVISVRAFSDLYDATDCIGEPA